MNIILIGFMGSGKSTVGAALAQEISFDFYEMDTIILKKTGFSDMSELFAKKGEGFLRDHELSLAAELSEKKRIIVSTGGGVVMNPNIIHTFKKDKKGLILYLHARFEVLAKRIKIDSTPRPLFSNIIQAKKLYDFRLPLYESSSHYTIDVSDKNIGEIVDEILQTL